MMAITSTDIQEQSFKIERRGYDVDEVDVFLERVANEIDALNKEVSSLQSQVVEAKRAAQKAAATPAPTPASSANNSADVASLRATIAQKDALISDLEAQVRERKNEDAAIAQALIVAQRTGDELVANAKADAEQTRMSAEEEARRILDKAGAEKQRVIDSINELNESRAEIRIEYQEMLKEFISSTTKRLAEIGGDTTMPPMFVSAEVVEEQPTFSASGASYASAASSWSPSPTATYTTPTVSSVVSTPATPKPSVASKDLSGYGDADDTFAFDEID